MPFWRRDRGSCISVRTGSVIKSSKVPIQEWAVALYLMADGSKGLSSHTMAKQLGVTRKTAYLLMHKVRQDFDEKGHIIR